MKPWLEQGHKFILEEDGDSRHGTGKSRNIMRKWKEQNGLNYYFNYASSPDLSLIENCWQPPKQHLRKYPHWDDAITKGLICEGWEAVSQELVNAKVITVPERLKAVLDSGGQMIGY